MTTKACVKASTIFLVAVFAMACGDAGNGVRAINLQSGQQQDFASEDELPPGWGVCPEDDCSTLPGVPCQNLGEAVCSSTPGCELVQLGCVVDGCPAAPDGADVPDCLPEPPRCDYACMPEGEKTCEQLTEEQDCTAKAECAWDMIACTMACAPDGECPPCPTTGICRTVAPDSCDALGATQCMARPDCEWAPQACPAIACAPDQPDCAVDCAAFCRSKDTTHCTAIGIPEPQCANGLPPVPRFDAAGCLTGYDCADECPAVDFLYAECENSLPPIPTFDERGCPNGFTCQVECPAIPMIYPDCQGGTAVPTYDDKGCLTGYECQECPAIPMLYPECQDGGQPVPSYDAQGCLTGYVCQTECPPMPEIAIDCAPDAKAVPTYDSAGCQTGFRCVPL